MRVVAVDLGYVWICDHYKGEVLERLDPMGQSGWENGEREVGRVEELVC